MKNLKRITALLLAAVLCVGSSNISAFAAEKDDNNGFSNMKMADVITNEDGSTEFVFDINPSSRQVGGTISPMSLVDQTFKMTSYHRGATRNYNRGNLGFTVYMTDWNGNTLTDGTILSVKLYTTTGILEREIQTSSRVTMVPHFGITYGANHYFEYAVAYGTQKLKIHMVIN